MRVVEEVWKDEFINCSTSHGSAAKAIIDFFKRASDVGWGILIKLAVVLPTAYFWGNTAPFQSGTSVW